MQVEPTVAGVRRAYHPAMLMRPGILLASLAVAGLLLVLLLRPADELAAVEPPGRGAQSSAPAASEAAPAAIRAPVVPIQPNAPVAASNALHVHVVYHAGRDAAEIDVVLVARLEGMTGEPELARAQSGADGRAALVPDADKLARVAMVGGVEFIVTTRLPGVPDVRHALSSEYTPQQAPPERPIVLRLPPLGRVAVRVLDEDGRPVADGVEVILAVTGRGAARWRATHAGVAHFAAMPLDCELRVTASESEARQAGESVTLRGPRQDDEEVTCELRVGRFWPRLLGRVVDEHGAPLPAQELLVGVGARSNGEPAEIAADRKSAGLAWRRLDAQGRFRIPVPESAPAGSRRFVVAVHQPSGTEVEFCAVAELPGLLAPAQQFDIGDLRLLATGTERLLASGRVVDERGMPLANVDVAAGYWDRAAGRWVSLNTQRVRSAADGTFVLRAVRPSPASFSLSASVAGRVPVQREISEGARGLELVLARGGRLRARIVAQGVPPQLLVGAIVDASGRRQEPNQAAGYFGAEHLAAGRYAVTVRIAQSNWELLRIEGIDVPAGGSADDQRLARIDVSELCRKLRLRLVDAQQAPLADMGCDLRDAERRGLRVNSDREGWIVAAVPRGAAALTVELADGRRGDVIARDGEQVVVVR